MRVIDYIRADERNNGIHIPIYTIHDNFLTTIEHVGKLPAYYRKAFQQFGHPLLLINKFIYDNIIGRAITLGLISNNKEIKTQEQLDEIELISRMYDDSENEGLLIPNNNGLEMEKTLQMNFQSERERASELERDAAYHKNTVLNPLHHFWMREIHRNKPFLMTFSPTLLEECIVYCLLNTGLTEKDMKQLLIRFKKLVNSYKSYCDLLKSKDQDEICTFQEYTRGLATPSYKQDYCIHH